MKFLIIFLLLNFLNATDLKEIILNAQNAELSKIKEYESLKQKIKRDALVLSYMPNLSIGGGYKKNSLDNFVITPDESVSGYARLDLIIYDGGARESRLDALSHLEQLEFIKSEEFKSHIAFECVRLYFNATVSLDILKAKSSEKEYLSSALKRLTALKTAGLSDISEYESVMAKYHMSATEELGIRQKLNKTLNTLKLLSNLEIKDIKGASLEEPNFNQAQNSINFDIRAKEFEYLAAKSGVKEVVSSHFPNIFLKDTFTISKSKFDKSFSSQIGTFAPLANMFLDEKTRKNNELMLGFELKLFDFGKTSKEEQIAKISQNQALLSLNYAKRENEIELRNLKDEINILTEKILANTLYVKASKTSLETTAKKYEAGLIGYTEFLLSLTQSFLAQSELSFSTAELEIKRAEYFYKSGDDIIKRIKE